MMLITTSLTLVPELRAGLAESLLIALQHLPLGLASARAQNTAPGRTNEAGQKKPEPSEGGQSCPNAQAD